MHKSFLAILLLFLISTQAPAQVRFGSVKCDSFQTTVDSTQAILYRKGKTGVYDLNSAAYLIKPTKNPLLFLESASLYLSISESGLVFRHFSGEELSFYYETNTLDNFYAHFPYAASASYANIADFTGTVLNYWNGDRVQTNPDFMAEFVVETRFEFKLLNAQKCVINYERTPFDQFIDKGGDYYDIDSGFAKSGVYDLELKKWDIPPIYSRCEPRDSFVFCLISKPVIVPALDEFYPAYVAYEYAYDVYVFRQGNYVLKMADLKSISEDKTAVLFGFDSVEIMEDSTHFISHKNGKSGFWQLELFRELDVYPPAVKLIYKEVLPAEYDFIKLDGEKDIIYTYQKKAANGLGLHKVNKTVDEEDQISKSIFAKEHIFYGRKPLDGASTLFIDHQTFDFSALFQDSSLSETIKPTVFKKSDQFEIIRGCGLTLLNDSLLYSLDFVLDSISPWTAPLKSFFYPDEDSIIIDLATGFFEAVYPLPFPGFDHSGIYNLNTNEWFISPKYQIITSHAGHFLMKQGLDTVNYCSLKDPLYTLKNREGALIFEDVPLSEIRENRAKYYPLLLPQENANIHPFPDRSIYNTSQELVENSGYYVQNKNGFWEIYHLFAMAYEISNVPITHPKELIHYCLDYDYFVYLDQDSLFLELPDQGRFAVQAEGGQIKMQIQSGEGLSEYKISMFEKGEERTYSTAGYDPSVYTEKEEQVALYYQADNHFFINENFDFNNLNQYFLDMDYFWGEELAGVYQHFQTETSMVWEKTNGLWEIKTPYYAEIIENPLGYLVRTGSYEVLDKTTGNVEVIASSRTLLLDKNYKAISFLDFFDFDGGWVYDFGVSLCTETGCFLIANNGEVITNAEWDDFELENGRLKAIRFKAFDPDFFWEVDPEDNIDKFEYFDLPAN